MKKIIFVVVLIFCLLSSTEIAYSYFEEENDIVIDEENPLYVLNEITSNNYQRLVPKGVILKNNETYALTFRYEVLVDQDVDLETLIDNIYLGDDTSDSEYLEDIFLFDIELDHMGYTQIGNGLFRDGKSVEKVEITVTVSMNEPTDLEMYNNVCNNYLRFALLLRVSKA